MFWKRFFELSTKKDGNPLSSAKKMQVAAGNITKWKNGTVPKGDMLLKIADYFNVSVDYLLGRTDYPEINNGQVIIDGKTIEGTVHKIDGGYIIADPDADVTNEDIEGIKKGPDA